MEMSRNSSRLSVLRCSDYRIFFKLVGESGIAVIAVRHRRDAYR